MNSKWIATAMLLLPALYGGCRAAPDAAELNPLNPQHVLYERYPLQPSLSSTLDPNPSRRSIAQVAYQEVVVDKRADEKTEKRNEPSLSTPPGSDDRSTVKPIMPPTNDVLSLAEIEQIALTNNPALSAAQNTLQKASGLYAQVGTRPNPILGYSGNQLADKATDQHTIFLEQEFVRGNKLALNRQVLSHTNDAQRWEIETQRYRVLTDVRVRFYEAIAAQRELDATKEFAKVARRGVEVAERLKEAGESTLIDVLQSRTLMSETNLAQVKAEAAYRGAWKDLAAIAGMPDLRPARLDGDLEAPADGFDWENTYISITAESPELAAARAIVCEKRAVLSRQEVQMIPNITAQLGAGYDQGTDGGLINVQVGAPIPVRNKNRGNISAAHAEYHRAAENVRRIELAIQSRLARAAQEFESANASVRTYEQEIMPQVEESLKLSEQAYQAGEIAFLQALVVRRNYYESRIRFIQAQGRLAQANAKIEGLLLTGGLDAPIDYTNGDGLRGQSFGGQ